MGRNMRENLNIFLEDLNCRFALYLFAQKDKKDPWQDELSKAKITHSKYFMGGYMIDRKEDNAGFTDFMFLTNTLLESFLRPLSERPKEMSMEYSNLIEKSLFDFYGKIIDKPIILDNPIRKKDSPEIDVNKMSDMILYLSEIQSILGMIEAFAVSRTKKETKTIDEDYLNDTLLITSTLQTLNKRLTKVEQFYYLSNTDKTVWYCSNGILPLVWCEIKFCIENNLKINICSYCGKIYYCPPNNPKKGHCGGRSCKNRFVQDRAKAKHGVHWEAERKSIALSGRQGRPKSKERQFAEKRHKQGISIEDIRWEIHKGYGKWIGKSRIKQWIEQLESTQ